MNIPHSSHLNVRVGVPVEVTHEERRQLEEAARLMLYSAKSGRAGWLRDYFNGHKLSHGILRSVIDRSHAGS